MLRFKSPEQAQGFLSAFEPIRGHFCPRRHRLSATRYRAVLAACFQAWREVTGVTTSA